MKPLPFFKIVGTGNDFVFIDLRSSVLREFSHFAKSELVARMCDRHRGIGADGVVFVENAPAFKGARIGEKPPALSWDFYNSDGSSAEMCGNAARCMGRWADAVLHESSIRFQTLAGIVEAHATLAEVSVTLGFVRLQQTEVKYQIGANEKSALLLNTGVPHIVVEVTAIEKAAEMMEEIAALRFHPAAGAAGANVTFLQVEAPQKFRTTTFERGVEGFTLACGTGVIAAAAVGLRQSAANSADLKTAGGLLRVKFSADRKSVGLSGAADIVFTGTTELFT